MLEGVVGEATLCLWAWWEQGCPVLVGVVGVRLPCACGHGGGEVALCLWAWWGSEVALCLWAWWGQACPVLVGMVGG